MLTLTCVHVRAYTLLRLLFAIKSIFTYNKNTGAFFCCGFCVITSGPYIFNYQLDFYIFGN